MFFLPSGFFADNCNCDEFDFCGSYVFKSTRGEKKPVRLGRKRFFAIWELFVWGWSYYRYSTQEVIL